MSCAMSSVPTAAIFAAFAETLPGLPRCILCSWTSVMSRPVIKASRMQPEEFIYQQVMPASSWNPVAGLYTRYGDVRPLLNEMDDRMVIMGSGDEISLGFNPSGLPALPSRWARDFFVMV